MKLVFSLLSCLAPLLLNMGFATVVEGSGKITTDVRPLPAFHEIHISGNAQIFLTQEDKTAIVIEGDDNIVPLIDTEVTNQILNVSHKNGKYFTTKIPLTYKISSPHIDVIRLMGSSHLKTDGSLNSDSFSLFITGSANADLTLNTSQFKTQISGSGTCLIIGHTDKEDVTISGSGQFLGDHFKAKKAKVKISGSGIARIHATDALEANISGSGHIFYQGHPKITKRIAGSGSVASAESSEE
ncbi:MAG: DUF2807 domain-containing protein [Simkaniaceae bacterium]|nr:DUF2807 domain-containing protein [Simkaniaceae bacterium]MCF7853024.1 DUF2807 domain-containing protein [Simkaniaceae bacterium]